MSATFRTDLARHVWDAKYRLRYGGEAVETDLEQTWRRVARALAEAEPAAERAAWAERFYHNLEDFRFLPGGRIQAGAGTRHRVTLFNCFVMGVLDDSMDGIFDGLKEGALTMQQGGGVGYDFSTLRPSGSRAHATGTIASGPLSFMRIWDSMCATILSTGARRGAMMATLRCDHPDIEAFIEAKRNEHELRRFNLSVQVTDDFMAAVHEDALWPLVFPLEPGESPSGEILLRPWTGTTDPVPCRVHRRVRARALWDRIMHGTYDYAEPGVLFVDHIQRSNNLWYRERITTTNPCGEIPLPPYGACNLGALNLTRFVSAPFSAGAHLDLDGVAEAATLATRMLDDVVDVSHFPLPRQAEVARGTRRLGLGLTGLGDTLILLGLHYGTEPGRQVAAQAMATVCHAAYRASIALAREKGPFPYFDRDRFLESRFVAALPDDIRQGIADHGLRNSHLTAIAPTGTISLLADNVSTGIEPVFELQHRRRVLEADGTWRSYELDDYALRLWRDLHGDAPVPETFVTSSQLHPRQHLAMQAALQPYVDNAISKTINVPEDFPFEAFRDLYETAWRLGCKGCTTFRPNPVTGAVLSALATAETQQAPVTAGPPRCGIDRECD